MYSYIYLPYSTKCSKQLNKIGFMPSRSLQSNPERDLSMHLCHASKDRGSARRVKLTTVGLRGESRISDDQIRLHGEGAV